MNNEQDDFKFFELKNRIDLIIKDRQLILKFKKSGRIREDYIYDSANHDLATYELLDEFFNSLVLKNLNSTENKNKITINLANLIDHLKPELIGFKFAKVFFPWERRPELEKVDEKTVIVKKGSERTQEEMFYQQGSVTVSDVIDQGKTIIVEFEGT